MSRRSQNRNQYETTTVGELSSGAFSVTVDSAAGLLTDQDMYLVIEPDVPGQREWIKVESITGNQLNIENPNGRNLTGSDGDLTHPAGSKVRSVPSQQIFEDIFQDAEDDELALTQHQTDGGDPHEQAGYLTEDTADPLYLSVAGDTLTGTGHISDTTTPSAPDHLARKGYVDDEVGGRLDEDAADLLYLRLDGVNPMTDDLDMGLNVIRNVANGSIPNDAVNIDQLGTVIGSITTHIDNTGDPHAAAEYILADGSRAMAAVLAMGGFKVTGLAAGTASGDAVEFDQMETADALRVLLTSGPAQTITSDLNIAGELEVTEGNQNLLSDLVRNFVINDGEPAVAVRGSFWLDPTDSVLSYSDGAAWVNGLSDLLNLSLNVVHDMFGRLLGPSGGVTLPAFAVGNSTSGLYQEGSYIGLTRNGQAVVVGDGDDELYMGGISAGSGDDLQAQGTQIRRVVSSRRFKNVGKAIDKATIRAKLMALPVYEWAYKDNPGEQIGWMAEDVAEVDPRLVNFDEEGRPNSIRTLAIMAVLT